MALSLCNTTGLLSSTVEAVPKSQPNLAADKIKNIQWILFECDCSHFKKKVILPYQSTLF